MITLANIQQASAQEIFNQAYIHLLTQNNKSMKLANMMVNEVQISLTLNP